MRGGTAALACALVAASCGGAASPVVRPVPVLTAPATTAAPLTPSPRPAPLTSAKGMILVREPASDDVVTTPVRISGEASVYEANVLWRVVTAGGQVLGEGFTTATAAGPARGTFEVAAAFEVPAYGERGFVEVFEEPADGGPVKEIVRVPVSIAGSY